MEIDYVDFKNIDGAWNSNCQGLFAYVDGSSDSSRLTINDGIFQNASMSYNTSSSLYGGLIYLSSGKEVTINGGSFKDNFNTFDRGSYGSLFYSSSYNSTFNILGGVYENNGKTSLKVSDSVGAVGTEATTNDYGGLLYCSASNGVVNIGGDTKISGHHAGYGGCIYATSNCTINIIGNCDISNCDSYYGGAIYNSSSSSTVNIKGKSKIHDCSSKYLSDGYGRGGAVYTFGNITTSENAVIDSCQANVYGGAIYVTSNSNVNITGSSILSNNKAKLGGAVYVDSLTKFTLGQNSTLDSNEAVGEDGKGGAVYLTQFSASTVNDYDGAILRGGKFVKNKAALGGSVYSERDVAFNGVASSNNITTGDPEKTSDFHMAKSPYIFENFAEMEDTIFLSDREYPIYQMESFQGDNIFNIRVAAKGNAQLEDHDYVRKDVFVDWSKSATLKSSAAYLSYFNLENSYFCTSANEDNKLVIGIIVFVDGDHGSDEPDVEGYNPENAFKTFACAADYMGDTEGAFYLSGPLYFNDSTLVSESYNLNLQYGQTIKRYDGFSIDDDSWDAYKGALIKVQDSKSLTTQSSVTISGQGNAYDSLITVDEGCSLTINGSTLLNNTIVTNPENPGETKWGGAIYSEGSVELNGETKIYNCPDSINNSVYHNGDSLKIASRPLMENAIYLTDSGDIDNPRVVYVNDPSGNDFSPLSSILLNMDDVYENRLVVEHSNPDYIAGSFFQIDRNIGVRYVLFNSPTAVNKLFLMPLKTFYINPETAKPLDEQNGVTADTAYDSITTLFESGEVVSSDYISIMLVNPIEITTDATFTNTSIQIGDGVEYKCRNINFVRYAKPKKDIDNFKTESNKSSMFIIDCTDTTKTIKFQSIVIDGHSEDVSTTAEAFDSYGVKDAASAFMCQNGNLTLGGSAKSTTCTIQNNDSKEFGGGIYVDTNGHVILNNATIKSTSAKNGGGIYTKGSVEFIYDSVSSSDPNKVSDCYAEQNGGAIYIDGNDSYCHIGAESWITGSKADVAGSSIYHNGLTTDSDNSLILQGNLKIDGELYLAEDKDCKLAGTGVVNTETLSVNCAEPYTGRVLFEVQSDTFSKPADFPLSLEIAKEFLLERNDTIKETPVFMLKANIGIYVDGVNGNDENAGDAPVPGKAVKSLGRAYQIAKDYETEKDLSKSYINIVNTVIILDDTKISAKSYSDSTTPTINLNYELSIKRYSKPTTTSGEKWAYGTDFNVDSFTGVMFTANNSPTFRSIVIDGHSREITKGNEISISHAVDSTEPILKVNDSSAYVQLMQGSTFCYNNNVTSDGGAINLVSGQLVLNGATISDVTATHGSAIASSGSLMFTGPSNLGTNEIFLYNFQDSSGDRGYFIDVNKDNPNGVDDSGNPKPIYVDLDQITLPSGYLTNRRIIARYTGTATMPENATDLFILKEEVPSGMNYLANTEKQQVWLLKDFSISVITTLDDSPAFVGAKLELWDKDKSTKLDSGTVDASGQYSFSTKHIDGDYILIVTDTDSNTYTCDLKVNDQDLNFDFLTYTVSFVTDYTENPPSQIVLKGEKATEPEVKATGYIFDGWFKDNTYKAKWDFDDSVLTTTELVAKWTSKEYTVAFNTLGGSGGDAGVTVHYGQDLPSIGTPINGVMAFEGYYDSYDESTKIVSGNKYYLSNGTSAKAWDKDVAEEDQPYYLYAKWADAKVSLTVAETGYVLYYFSLADALEQLTNYDGCTIKLLKDIKEYDLVIPAGLSTTIDLNGLSIDAQGNGSALKIEGTLTLDDSSEKATGKVIGGKSNGADGGTIDICGNSALLTMNKGTVSGESIGINVSNSTAHFIMNDGTITDCTSDDSTSLNACIYYSGEILINGGAINNHKNSNDYTLLMNKNFSGNPENNSICGGYIYGPVAAASMSAAGSVSIKDDIPVAYVAGGWTSQQIYVMGTTNQPLVCDARGLEPLKDEEICPVEHVCWSVNYTDKDKYPDLSIVYNSASEFEVSGQASKTHAFPNNKASQKLFRVSGQIFTITDPEHHEFVGWDDDSAAKVAKYLKDGIATFPSDQTVYNLYSICSAAQISVPVNTHGGTTVPNVSGYFYATPAPLDPDVMSTRDGYVLLGYYSDENIKFYNADGTVASDKLNWGEWDVSNHSLHAVWADTSGVKLSFTYGTTIGDAFDEGTGSFSGRVKINEPKDTESIIECTASNFTYPASGTIGYVDPSTIIHRDDDSTNIVGYTLTITQAGTFQGEVILTTIPLSVSAGSLIIAQKELQVNAGVVAQTRDYDGQTSVIIDSTGATFDAIVGSDKVSISGVTGVLRDGKDAGVDKYVTLSYSAASLTETDHDPCDYKLAENQTAWDTIKVTITPKPITAVSGLTSVTKVYDKTTAMDILTKDAVFNGIVSGDTGVAFKDATISGSVASGDINVGTGKTVTISYSPLPELNNTNYVLASSGNQASTSDGEITPKPITVSGLKAVDKPYDKTQDISIDCSEAEFDGVISGDSVSISDVKGSVTKEDMYVGDSKTVNLDYSYSSLNNSNYMLDMSEGNTNQKTATVNITPKAITISSADVLSAIAKPYDNEDWMNIDTSTATFNGVCTGDTVKFKPGVILKGNIDTSESDLNVGKNKKVIIDYSADSFKTYELDNYNYVLLETENPAYVSDGEITAKAITVTGGLTSGEKVYDRLAYIEVDCSGATFAGVVEGDTVSIDLDNPIYGNLTDVNAGQNKEVQLKYEKAQLTNSNYSLDIENSIKTINDGKVTPKPIKVTAGLKSVPKEYNKDADMKIATKDAVFDGMIEGDQGLGIGFKDSEINGSIDAADVYVGENKTVTISYDPLPELNNNNYVLMASGNQSSTNDGKIVPRVISVNGGVQGVTKTYDQKTKIDVDSSEATYDRAIADDEINLTGLTGVAVSPDAGTQTINLNYDNALIDNVNYSLDKANSIKTVNTIIEPKEITLDMVTILPMEELIYDGTPKAPTVSIKFNDYELIEGIDYDYNPNPKAELGPHFSYVNALTGNYTVTNLEIPWEMVEQYIILDGDFGVFVKGTPDPIAIRCNGPFYGFEHAEIDGTLIDPINYDIEDGSTILTLHPEYMNTLAVGEHALKFVYKNLGEAAGHFTIYEVPQDQDLELIDTAIVPTGDILLGAGIAFGLLMIIFAGIYIFSRKRKTLSN